jgi:hypothetical protein
MARVFEERPVSPLCGERAEAMSKEPGQLAAEGFAAHLGQRIDWPSMSPMGRDVWIAIESTIRADERAKVWASTVEECFKEIEVFLSPDDTPEYQQGIIDAIEALRAKMGDGNG